MTEMTPPVGNPPLRLMVSLHDYLKGNPDWLLTVPGREMWVAAQPNGKHYHLFALPDWNARLKFDALSIRRHKRTTGQSIPHRMRYLAAAAHFLQNEGVLVPGIKAVIVGNEPAGPRYEHSLGLALLTLWHSAAGKSVDAPVLMALMEKIERDYL